MGTCTSTICDEALSSNAVRAVIVEKSSSSAAAEEAKIYDLGLPTNSEDPVDLIRQGVVGQRHSIRTPFGQRQLVYADYTASGRFLAPVEEFFTNKIAPLYANTHTEEVLREEARFIVAHNVNAPARKYLGVLEPLKR